VPNLKTILLSFLALMPISFQENAAAEILENPKEKTFSAPILMAKGDVSVKGYYRKNGTYVSPHHRSSPDGIKSNNWSSEGNVNPYTGTIGTKKEPIEASASSSEAKEVDASGIAVNSNKEAKGNTAETKSLTLRSYSVSESYVLLNAETDILRCHCQCADLIGVEGGTPVKFLDGGKMIEFKKYNGLGSCEIGTCRKLKD